MAKHYTRNVVSDSKYCKTCNAVTPHTVQGGRIGWCIPCDEKRREKWAEEKKRRAGLPQQGGFDFSGKVGA
jgi:hypothetical protein